MPTVFVCRGLRFFFYFNEGDEPPHVQYEELGEKLRSGYPTFPQPGIGVSPITNWALSCLKSPPTIGRSWTAGDVSLDTRADLVEAIAACVTHTHVVVTLADGQEIATPLDWYPALVQASPAAPSHVEVSPFGVHWADLDEDLSVEGMLRGVDRRDVKGSRRTLDGV